MIDPPTWTRPGKASSQSPSAGLFLRLDFRVVFGQTVLMSFPVFWTPKKLTKLRQLYQSGLSMREVGGHFGKSVWAINSVMKRQGIQRRNRSETNHLQFLKSPLSFKPKAYLSYKEQLLRIAGLMLYWGEGAKKNSHSVDFANSDPEMIAIFLQFLRNIYQIDESRLRIYLYSYNSLPTNELITYWSKVTNIPTTQFSKPYIRLNSDLKHDKMQHGLIHIRYADTRLFRLIMDEIQQIKYSWGTQVDNEVRL